MKFLSVQFLLVISSFFLLEYPAKVAAAVLSKPEIVYVERTCAENEVYSQCHAKANCEKSCDNIDIWESLPCTETKSCLSGCTCEEGYVRDRSQGTCVLENSCPRVRH